MLREEKAAGWSTQGFWLFKRHVFVACRAGATGILAPPSAAQRAVMRILHVVPTYFPARRYGGPIVAVHGLCKELAARGHAVDVFTTNVDGTDEIPLDRLAGRAATIEATDLGAGDLLGVDRIEAWEAEHERPVSLTATSGLRR